MPELAQLHGPLLVTVAYFALWYAFLFGGQTRTKYRLKARYASEGKVFDRYFGQDPEMLAVDRAVANTHEQQGPFLASLWLFAVFVSPEYATALGAAYAAGLATGVWGSLDELRQNWQEDSRWTPNMDDSERERQLRNWKKAVTKTFDWVDDDVN